MLKVKQKPQLHASWIDPFAKEIVKTLQREGFTTYLVGGCVRDLLAGLHPKDYDIATNAEPNQVRRKVYGSYVIGKRFRLVLVKRGDQQFEVATFRRESTPEDFADLEEPISGDNFFGTPEQDALRRDFTINALFYDPIKDELVDYAEGMKDIESRMIRMIGNPSARILEDPIRSLRAIRLSHKLSFRIEESFRLAIQEHAAEVAKSVLPRRREEYLKTFRLEEPHRALLELYDLGLMHSLMPSLALLLDQPERREIFFDYLWSLKDFVQDPSATAELYAPIILGFIRASHDIPDQEKILDQFMRNELGMFRTEQASVLEALSIQDKLGDTESFIRRGHRRKSAFLYRPEFSLALRIADLEFTLPPKIQAFWRNQVVGS